MQTISATAGSAQGTINNDDGFGLSIVDSSVEEGDSGQLNMPFTVTLIPANPTNDITFKWAASMEQGDTADDTADTGDFIATADNTGTITMTETTTTINVPVRGDTVSEDSETFTVTLTDPASAGTGETVKFIDNSGSVATTVSAKGTITDNDGPVIGFQQNVEFSEE